MGTVPSGPRRSLWRRRTIDGIHLGVSAKIARLVTAYGAEGGEGLVGMPVDMREFLPGLRTTAGVTGHVKIYVGRDDGWSDVDAKLLTGLGELQFLAHRGDPAALTMPVPFMREMRRWLDNLARQDHGTVREKRLAEFVAGVSHLGAVDLDELSADGFEATSCYCLGAVSFAPELDILESRGRTEITLTWRDGPGVAVARRGSARPRRGIPLTARPSQLGRQPAPAARWRRRRSPGCSPARRSGRPARWPSAAAPTAS